MTGWWGLKAILDANRQEIAQYNSQPPTACPNCGLPLVSGSITVLGGVKQNCLNCPGGDYRYIGGPRLT